MDQTVIFLHPQAPAKPATGEMCNGCGACCAAEPCPLGSVISLRRKGRCPALEWDAGQERYACGLLTQASRAHRGAGRLVARWIAAGQGCDAELETARPLEADLPMA